jgi:hypothetical protein
MLKELLEFLADELNNYLHQKGEVIVANASPRFVLGNVARAYESETLSGADPVVNNGIISVVNIEEDRVAKQQENYVKADTTVKYKSPPLYLNIYVLIAINRNNYGVSMTWLNYVLQFFQHQNVFTHVTHPSLDSRIQKLMVDLYSPSFEQVNHLWSSLGGKYLPSVLYKIRQVMVDEDLVVSESGLIRNIQFTEKSKEPISG